MDGTLELRPIPPDCEKCPKRRILHPNRTGEKAQEIGAEPTEWVTTMHDLYSACKMIGVLPAAGGLLDQERMVMRAFIELGVLDSIEDKAWRGVVMSRVAILGGLGG